MVPRRPSAELKAVTRWVHGMLASNVSAEVPDLPLKTAGRRRGSRNSQTQAMTSPNDVGLWKSTRIFENLALADPLARIYVEKLFVCASRRHFLGVAAVAAELTPVLREACPRPKLPTEFLL